MSIKSTRFFFINIPSNVPVKLTKKLNFLLSAAFQHVRDNLSDLNGKAGADENDLVFLKGLMDSPAVKQLIKVSPFYLFSSFLSQFLPENHFLQQ